MRVYIGDMTEIETDVIVNAADEDFSPDGGLAKAIAEAGGQEIFEEGKEHMPVELGGVYETGAGDLPCRAVFHIPTVDWDADEKITPGGIQEAVADAVELAYERGYEEIVFPLLAAGVVGLDEREVVKEMVEGIQSADVPVEASLCVLDLKTYEQVRPALPVHQVEHV